MPGTKQLLLSLLAAGLALALIGAAVAVPAAAAPEPARLPTPTLIEQALARGEITEAESVLYLAYALYEPQSLPPQFQSSAGWYGTRYVQEVDAYLQAPAAAATGAVQQELARLDLLAATVCAEEDRPNSSDSAHFHLNYGAIGGGLTLADYSTSLEKTFTVEVTDFGWAQPPLCAGGADCGGSSNPFGRYPVQVYPLGGGLYGYVTTRGEYSGFVGDNPNTAATEIDAYASCMVLNDNYSAFSEGAQAALDATTAHEFVHSIQFGYGDPAPYEDDMWYESSASALEDDVFDDSNSNYFYLWPQVSNSLGEWPDNAAPSGLSQYSNFLFFRHVAEHNGGVNTPGGGEEILQRFWENVATGQGALVAYDNALRTVGANLADAFHHYAIATRFSKSCGGNYVAPYCFEEGAAYVAAMNAPGPAHGIIAASPGSYNGSIRNHYAANWVDLPTSGSPYRVTLTNTAAGGQLRGSLVCDTGAALTVVPFPSVAGAGAATSVASFSAGGCTRLTAVITNQEQTSANPGSTPAQGYTLAVSSAGPTATPTATSTATPTATPTVTPTPTPAGPQARGDTAITLPDTPVLIDVLANDLPGANPKLTLAGVTQPLSGTAAIEQNRVHFTPTLGFSGSAYFTYNVSDGSGRTGSANVAVVVAAPPAVSAPPQRLSLPNPGVATTLTATLTSTAGAGIASIVLPAGAVTASVPGVTTFDLVFTQVLTPAQPLAGAAYAGSAFVLDLYVDARAQPGYVFATPILITVGYDPALVPDTGRLALYYYDAQAGRWSEKGIRVVAVDPQQHTFTASVAHLTAFAAGMRAESRLYLPAVGK